jgi:hypothetical protein
MRAPVAIVVAAALALAAPAAAQRPRPPDRPPTSVVPTLTPNRIQIYNDYEVPETTLDAGDVVVHYVTGGINAPPLNDDDGDGIPDFVRRVGDAADNALAYYRARGFVPPAPDTGGPDARPDLYVSRFAPGILGVAFPAPAADGGAFVALANQLDPSIDVSFGSLWGTVAHELFHLVQFSYYGTREPTMPDWVSEGTAAGMESRVFPALADLVNRLQVSAWLRRPTVPLTVATGGHSSSGTSSTCGRRPCFPRTCRCSRGPTARTRARCSRRPTGASPAGRLPRRSSTSLRRSPPAGRTRSGRRTPPGARSRRSRPPSSRSGAGASPSASRRAAARP